MKNKNISSAIILCGGDSRRMGEDKGSMEIDKKPMIIHVLESLISEINEVVIVLNDSKRIIKYKSLIQEYLDSFDFDIIFVEDEIKNKGPLSGIMTGLKTINSDYGLVLPCDSPYISSDFVQTMFNTLYDFIDSDRDIEGIVPYHINDDIADFDLKEVILKNTEPLHSIYKKKNYSIIEDLLKSDEKQVKSFINLINSYFIPINTNVSSNKINEINFININYKKDL